MSFLGQRQVAWSLYHTLLSRCPPQRSVQHLLGAECLARLGGDGDDCPALRELAVQLGEVRKCLSTQGGLCAKLLETAEEVGRGPGKWESEASWKDYLHRQLGEEQW